MLLHTLLINATWLLVAVCLLWLVGTLRKDVSLADPFWGAGFVGVAWVSLAVSGVTEPRILLLAILTTLWGLRLGAYLLWRNWGQEEDRRYAEMRKRQGSRFWWLSLFTVFLLQGVILWFVSLPIQLAATYDDSKPLGWLDVAGIIVWTLGVFFEAVGDWQLSSFKAKPENSGKVMDRGLWHFTRHPNYFGDFCVWWGLYLIASAGGAYWTFLSPLLMSVLLMKVSGVTLLEGSISDRRPDYARYKARTSSFFPWFPMPESASSTS